MSIESKIFGYVLGDGWIDINGQMGASGDYASLYNLSEDAKLLYGENSAKQITKRHTFSEKYGISGVTAQMTFSSETTRHFVELGMPIGKRVQQEHSIPDWILNGSKDIKADFLSGYYAAEGYIPSMQRNLRTPKALTFCFYKSTDYEDNAKKLCLQFLDLIKDLGFGASSKKSYKTTNGPRVVYTITFSNEEKNFLEELKTMELSYCIPKEKRRQQLIRYFSLKQIERNKIESIRKFVCSLRESGCSYKEIHKISGININSIGSMLSGKNKCHQVRGFPKFDKDFIDTYCSTETPLIDENLSDITRQATTSQVFWNEDCA